MEKGNKLTGALARSPKEKVGERLSPGVYRGDKGSLVNKSGRVIPRGQPSSQQMPPPESYNRLPGYRGMESMGKGPAFSNEGSMQMTTPSGFANMIGRDPSQIQSGMYMVPNMPQIPQASANNGGQYRLSPGVYGSREQAMNQYNQQMQQLYQPINGLGQQGNMPPMDWSSQGPIVPYAQRRG